MSAPVTWLVTGATGQLGSDLQSFDFHDTFTDAFEVWPAFSWPGGSKPGFTPCRASWGTEDSPAGCPDT